MSVTFTITGKLSDFGDDPRAGVKILAAPTPSVKIGAPAVYGTEPESVLTDADGEFTIELVSIVGLWYRITAPRASGINPVRLAAYVVDPGDPTTGTVFPPATTFDLVDIMDEDPTPGYQAVTFTDTSTLVLSTDPRLSDDRNPLPHTHDDRYFTESETTALLAGHATDGELAAEVSARAGADAALLTTIGTETTQRTAADAALDARVQGLEDADFTDFVTDDELDDAVTAEAALRAAADAALDGRLDTLEAAPDPVVDHGALTGLADDDHTQYHNNTRGDARYYLKAAVDSAIAGRASDAELATEVADRAAGDAALDVRVDALEAGGGGGGVTDHGALTGLGDDDHTQYHTDARGDARYYLKAAVDTAISGRASDAELATEASTRASADTALDARLDTLEAVDTSAYATDAELATEASTRAAADTALDGRLDTLEAVNTSLYATDVELAAAIATRAPSLGSDDNYVTDAEKVKVAALGTASSHAHTDYATAAQGTKADTALQAADITGKLDTSAAPELIRDTMGTAIVAGTNMTVTVNDAGDTITLDASGGGSGLTAPQVAARVWIGV